MSKAVSFSRNSLYKKCPASYEWQYVLGHKEEFNPGPAALRGTRIHDSIEQGFLMQSKEPFDPEIPEKVSLWLQEPLQDSITGKCQAFPEMQFCLNAEWESVEFDAEDGYIRGFMDNVFVYENRVHVHEYKTGRKYDEHAHQKQLYAMVCLLLYPDISEVTVEGIYIDSKEREATIYSRSHLTSMKYTWKREIDRMFIPMYPARPGIQCRWCPKSSNKGGTCQLG
jgi:hypothetical protein